MKTSKRLLHSRGGNLPSESTCKPIRLLFLILFALLGLNGAWADDTYYIVSKNTTSMTTGMANATNQILKIVGNIASATTDISATVPSSMATLYYLSTEKGIGSLTSASNYGTDSSDGNKTMQGYKVTKTNSLSIDLNGKTMSKAWVVYYCNSEDDCTHSFFGEEVSTSSRDISVKEIDLSSYSSSSLTISTSGNSSGNSKDLCVLVILKEAEATPSNLPAKLIIMGNIGASWSNGDEVDGDNGIYVWNKVTFTSSYPQFKFGGNDSEAIWAEYGPATNGETATLGGNNTVDDGKSSANIWSINQGTYKLTLNLITNKLKVEKYVTPTLTWSPATKDMTVGDAAWTIDGLGVTWDDIIGTSDYTISYSKSGDAINLSGNSVTAAAEGTATITPTITLNKVNYILDTYTQSPLTVNVSGSAQSGFAGVNPPKTWSNDDKDDNNVAKPFGGFTVDDDGVVSQIINVNLEENLRIYSNGDNPRTDKVTTDGIYLNGQGKNIGAANTQRAVEFIANATGRLRVTFKSSGTNQRTLVVKNGSTTPVELVGGEKGVSKVVTAAISATGSVYIYSKSGGIWIQKIEYLAAADNPVTGITVSAASGATSIKAGKSLQLTATVTPNSASDQTVSWSSNNPNVTVSNTGLVSANTSATGDVTITATANDGSGVTGQIPLSIVAKTIYTLKSISASTLWDFTQEGLATGALQGDKSTNEVFANVPDWGVPDNDSGRSGETYENNAEWDREKIDPETLKGVAQYYWRGNDNRYFQGNSITFNTTVSGTVKVWYSGTNTSGQDRTLKVDNAGGTSQITGDIKSLKTNIYSEDNFIEVPVFAGDVKIYCWDNANGKENLCRIYKIEFTPGQVARPLDVTINYENVYMGVGTEKKYNPTTASWNLTVKAGNTELKNEEETTRYTVSYESSNPSVCTVSGDEISLSNSAKAGQSATITATFTPLGDYATDYAVATATFDVICVGKNGSYTGVTEAGIWNAPETSNAYFVDCYYGLDGNTANHSVYLKETLAAGNLGVRTKGEGTSIAFKVKKTPMKVIVTHNKKGERYIAIKTKDGGTWRQGTVKDTYTEFTINNTDDTDDTEYIIAGAEGTSFSGSDLYVSSIEFVPQIGVERVTLDRESATLAKGETLQLTATVLPENAANKNVTWETNNSGVATVSSTGLVTASSSSTGTATITVTTADGNHTATCSVTVAESVSLQTISAATTLSGKMGFTTGEYKDVNTRLNSDHNLELVTSTSNGDVYVSTSGVKIRGRNLSDPATTASAPAPAYMRINVSQIGSLTVTADASKGRDLHIRYQNASGVNVDMVLPFTETDTKTQKFYLENLPERGTDVYFYVMGGAITVHEIVYTPNETANVTITAVKIGGKRITENLGVKDNTLTIKSAGGREYRFFGQPTVEVEYNTGVGTATQTIANSAIDKTYKNNLEEYSTATFTVNSTAYTIKFRQVNVVSTGDLTVLPSNETTRISFDGNDKGNVYIMTTNADQQAQDAQFYKYSDYLKIYGSESHNLEIDGSANGNAFFVTHGEFRYFEIKVGGPGLLKFDTKTSNSNTKIWVMNGNGDKVGEISTFGNGSSARTDCTWFYTGGATRLHFVPVGGDITRLNYIEWTPYTLNSIAITPAGTINLDPLQQQTITVTGTYSNNVTNSGIRTEDITTAVGLTYSPETGVVTISGNTMTANTAGTVGITASMNNVTSNTVTVIVTSNDLQTLYNSKIWIAGTNSGKSFGEFSVTPGTTITKTMLNDDRSLRAYATEGNGLTMNQNNIIFSDKGVDGESRCLEFKIGTQGIIYVKMENLTNEAHSYIVVARKSDGSEEVLRTMTMFNGDDGGNGVSTLEAYYTGTVDSEHPVSIFIRSAWNEVKLTELSFTPATPSIPDTGTDVYSRFSGTVEDKLVGIGSTFKVDERLGNKVVATPITVEHKDGFVIESIEVEWEQCFDHDDDLVRDDRNWNVAKFDYVDGNREEGIEKTTFYPIDGSKTVTIEQKSKINPWKVKKVTVHWVHDTSYKTPLLTFEKPEGTVVKTFEVWQGQALDAVLPTLYAKDGETDIKSQLNLTFKASNKEMLPDGGVITSYPELGEITVAGKSAIAVTSEKDETLKYLPAATEYTLVVQPILPAFTELAEEIPNVNSLGITKPGHDSDYAQGGALEGLEVYYYVLAANSTDKLPAHDSESWQLYTTDAVLQSYITTYIGNSISEFIIYAFSRYNGFETEVTEHKYIINDGVLRAPLLEIFKDATVSGSSITNLQNPFPDNQFKPEHGNLYARVTNTTDGATVYYEVIQMGFDSEGNNLQDYRGNFRDNSDKWTMGTSNNASHVFTIQNSVNIRIWAVKEEDGVMKRSADVIRRIVYNDDNTNVITSSGDVAGGTERPLIGLKITYGGISELPYDKWNKLGKDAGEDLNGDGHINANERQFDTFGAKGVLVYRDGTGDNAQYVSITAENDALSEYAEFDSSSKVLGKVKTSANPKLEGAAGHNGNGGKIGGSEFNHGNVKHKLVHERTFNLPVFGAFWKFEPEQNGELILHVQQQGCLNKYKKTDTDPNNKSLYAKKRYDEIRKRPVYFVDEMGNSIQAKSFSTEAYLDPEFANFYDDNRKLNSEKDSKADNFCHLTFDSNGKENGMIGMKNSNNWYSNQECWHMFDMYKTFMQETSNNGGYHPTGLVPSIWDTAFKYQVKGTGEDADKWVDAPEGVTTGGRWAARTENMGWLAKQDIIVLHADAAHNPRNYSPNLLAKLAKVNQDSGDDNFDGTGYMMITEGYAKYRFPVEAGKTYFFFGWRTKFGVSGYEWIPNPAYDKNLYTTKEKDGKQVKEMKTDRCFTLYNTDAEAIAATGKTNSGILADKNYKLPDFYETEYNHTEHRQYHVTVKRTFKTKEWAPIVLPFSVSQTQLRKIFGDKVQVLHFDKIEENKDEDNTYNLHFLKHHYQMLVAGTPAYIYPNGKAGNIDLDANHHVVDPVFSDVTLEMNRDAVVPVTDALGNRMNGSLDNGGIPQFGVYISGNKFYQYRNKSVGNDPLNINSLRAWIELAPRLKTAGARINMTMFDVTGGLDEKEELTGIVNVEIDGVIEKNDDSGTSTRRPIFNNRIYSLRGQYVGTSADIELLPKGIYILNGKKFVKK